MGKLFPRIRLLPLVVIVAFVMMTVKVGGIWNDVSQKPEGVGIESQAARAQSAQPSAQSGIGRRFVTC